MIVTSIRHILNWGEWHTVLLACGHRLKLRRAEVKQRQLFLGKPIVCTMCAIKKSKGQGR